MESGHRLARPEGYAAHALRFTRPLRQRLLGEQATRRRTAVVSARGPGSMNPVTLMDDRAPDAADSVVTATRPSATSPVAPNEARARDRHRRAAATTASAIVPKLLNLAILLIGARFVARALPPDGFGVWLR